METLYKDVYIFLEEHKEKAHKIVDLFMTRTRKYGYNGICCISGVSGCGKSEIAHFVSQYLYDAGISSHIINLDKYYKIHHSIRNQHRRKSGLIGPDEINWKEVERELFKYDNNKIQVLILEGLYASKVEGIRFHIECSIEESEYFRKTRNKEPEDTDWRRFIVGEEYSKIMETVKDCDYRI